MRIHDVVRAALGEVEGYQRVRIRSVEPVTVLGSAAADLAHILAELVENALVFSSEDQFVDVRGGSAGLWPGAGPGAGGGSGGTYTLAVVDHGVGMTPVEVARANRRLGGTESFTVAPSKYLGHYVAGNLAARHGISITLHGTPGGGPHQPGDAGSGITALVRLPAALLTTPVEGVAAPAGDRELVGVGAAGAAVAPEPTDGGRTASGLVRRSRPAGADRSAPAFEPPPDLIDALARHTSFADPPRPALPPPPPAPPNPGPTPGDDT
jgi:hypothetical protein